MAKSEPEHSIKTNFTNNAFRKLKFHVTWNNVNIKKSNKPLF